MYPLNQLKTLVSCGRDPARSLPLRRGFLLIPLMLVVLCVSPKRKRCNTPTPSSAPNQHGGWALNSPDAGTCSQRDRRFQFSIWFLPLLSQPRCVQHRSRCRDAPSQYRKSTDGRWLRHAFEQHYRCEQHRMRHIRAVYQLDRRVQQCRWR